MDTTTAAQTNRLRSTGTMAALVAVVAIFSTGCTAAEIDQFLTLLKIIATVAPLLEVAVGSPLLAVSRLIRDADERPVQWLQGLYRPDRYHYEMQLSRVGSIDAKVWVSKDLAAPFH